MKHLIGLLIIAVLMLNSVFAQKSRETVVLMQTNLGTIKIKLYNETPAHRDNFVKLVNSGFYDSLLFHRVIKDFMIQGGDPDSKHAPQDKMLGTGGNNYTVPAEFNPAFIHKKGALAAARQGDQVNPLKASSGCQFYIVQGKPSSDAELNQIEQTINQSLKNTHIKECLALPEHKALKDEMTKYRSMRNHPKMDSLNLVLDKIIVEKYKPFKYTDQQRETYKTLGGTPFLDMNYTVFGEVIEGADIIGKIATVPTQTGDRPQTDVIIIKARIVK